jgi:hypothetical protein
MVVRVISKRLMIRVISKRLMIRVISKRLMIGCVRVGDISAIFAHDRCR